jgi:hypothetical protein
MSLRWASTPFYVPWIRVRSAPHTRTPLRRILWPSPTAAWPVPQRWPHTRRLSPPAMVSRRIQCDGRPYRTARHTCGAFAGSSAWTTLRASPSVAGNVNTLVGPVAGTLPDGCRLLATFLRQVLPFTSTTLCLRPCPLIIICQQRCNWGSCVILNTSLPCIFMDRPNSVQFAVTSPQSAST